MPVNVLLALPPVTSNVYNAQVPSPVRFKYPVEVSASIAFKSSAFCTLFKVTEAPPSAPVSILLFNTHLLSVAGYSSSPSINVRLTIAPARQDVLILLPTFVVPN